tara:strand:- start:535 stop:1407 length:873 start_codon:yes stop_codon:yes gene_type:complete
MAEDVTQTTITQAPEYLRPGIEKFLDLSVAQAGDAIDTSKFAPSVVGLGALQQQAQQQAATQAGLGTLQFDPTTGAVSGVSGTGVAGFQPFLQAAQDLTSPTAFQQFESPYQQAVRDATLQAFDEQAAARQQQIADSAVAMGAFGGGREGVQRAEYQRKSDMDRALLQAQLNQAGFTQAQDLASQAFNRQQGLAQLQPQLAAQNIGISSGLGQQDLAFRQAVQDAQAQANQMAAFEPINRLARFGQGLTGVGGGLGSVQTMTGPAAPQQSPLAGAINTGIGAFTLGKLFG